MRMRKKQWAEPYLEVNSSYVMASPEMNKGKWKEVLQCSELHIEIGCGKGDYITQMADKDNNVGWVGVERDRNVAAVAAKKIVESEKSNVKLIALDAQSFDTWFEEGEIDVIHLNFSDPWPKAGYKKRRLSHRNFLEQYAKNLTKQGQVIMKTDNCNLFEFSLCEFSECGWNLVDVSVDFRRNIHDEDAITEYESKFMGLNQPIYRAVWQKKA